MSVYVPAPRVTSRACKSCGFTSVHEPAGPRHLAPQQSFDAERREHLARIGVHVPTSGRHVATETDRGAA
jgi:hypothetical protein